MEDEEHSVSNESRSGESTSDKMATEFPAELVEYEIQDYIDQNYDGNESESGSKDETRIDLEDEEEEEEEHTSAATRCAVIKEEVQTKLTVDREFEEYFSMLML